MTETATPLGKSQNMGQNTGHASNPGRIVFADDGIAFDGTTPHNGPLGGAESAAIALLEMLAARGHDVSAHTNCAKAVDFNGVAWRPLKNGLPETADLFIANRGDKLILAMPGARQTIFWIHNPARYVLKFRYLWKLLYKRPPIVFIGDYHARTYPCWAPSGGRFVIPYGLTPMFLEAEPASEVPAKKAIFTSNPMRGLDWLLDRWQGGIASRVPGAELHLFCGAAVYGAHGSKHAEAMNKVLDRARQMADLGVVLRDPVPKAELVAELKNARVLLYQGDLNETFCAAVAEAQALGVPSVVTPLGSMPERVEDGKTGAVAQNDQAFEEAAVAYLTDDDLWRRTQSACLATQRRFTWEEAATAFEKFIPSSR